MMIITTTTTMVVAAMATAIMTTTTTMHHMSAIEAMASLISSQNVEITRKYALTAKMPSDSSRRHQHQPVLTLRSVTQDQGKVQVHSQVHQLNTLARSKGQKVARGINTSIANLFSPTHCRHSIRVMTHLHMKVGNEQRRLKRRKQ